MSKLSAIHAQVIQSRASAVLAAVTAALASENSNSLREAGRYAFSSESISGAASEQLVKTANSLDSSLRRLTANEAFKGFEIGDVQLAAATESAFMASAVRNVIDSTVTITSSDTSVPFVGVGGLGDAFAGRSLAREAYNEQDNKDVLASTVTYNILAGRQNKAGELLFPTVSVPADNMGVSVTIRLHQVHDDYKRLLSGARADFNRKNIIRGLIDHTILKNDLTRAVPVKRAENAAAFATGADFTFNLDGTMLPTAPLAFGQEVDLLALSATDAMLAKGVMDRTDSLDSAVIMDTMYLKVGTDIIALPTGNLALSNFIQTGQDNYRVQKMNFDSAAVVINASTKNIAGAAISGDLAGIVSGKLSVAIHVEASGTVNIESGNIKVSGASFKVVSIYDTTSGTALDTTALGTGKTIADAITAGELLGYGVKAYRANANRRERGQLLDTTYYTQIWAVPLRSPLTALRPVNAPVQDDGAMLECLASATFMRTSGEAITTALETAEILKAQAGLNLDPTLLPAVLGVARHLVIPTYIDGTVDVKNINNLSTYELELDIKAVLVNRIRDIAYRLYRDSGFQAVVESGAAGTTEEPTVLVVTDPMTARYLMVDGDVRTAGPTFAMKVETTPDVRMSGRILVAFGYPEQNSNVVNALHFGNMLWSPELALVLPISRDGQISKELTVSPRFRHIVNVPVMGFLEIENLPDVVQGRVPLPFLTVS